LQVAGNKTALVDRLYSHLSGTREDINDSPQAATNTEAQGLLLLASKYLFLKTCNPSKVMA